MWPQPHDPAPMSIARVLLLQLALQLPTSGAGTAASMSRAGRYEFASVSPVPQGACVAVSACQEGLGSHTSPATGPSAPVRSQVQEITMANEYQLRLRDANSAEELRKAGQAAAADKAAAAERYIALQQAKDQQELDQERQLAAQTAAAQVPGPACGAVCACL